MEMCFLLVLGLKTMNSKILNELDIRENLSDGDTIALTSIIQYCLLRCILSPRVLEVGSWKGWSTQVIATIIKPHHGHIFAVDNWRGSDGDWNVQAAKDHDIFSIFRYNMTQLNLMDIIHPLVMNSMDAAAIFKDNSVDMIFIDANHRYTYTHDDITEWGKKLKEGGVICGHDCERYYTQLTPGEKQQVDSNPETDVIPGIGHPGVIKAVYDIYGEDYIIYPGSRVWYHLKL